MATLEKQAYPESRPQEGPDDLDYEYDPPISYSFIKRASDIIVASIVLLLSLPLLILLAVLIKRDSPGPALFTQTRIGQNRRYSSRKKRSQWDRRKADLRGKPFRFYKFRTMYQDANERWPELYDYEYTTEAVETMRFKLEDDPRLTRTGRILRRTTLDELPNFINVLLGGMTLVGPRPDIPEMVKYYKPWQTKKFKVKPGITGLAQVEGRGRLTFQETLAKDVEYVDNQSVRLDLQILLDTIRAIYHQDGAF